MITDNLYSQVLWVPAEQNRQLNRLFVVSGYATAAMAFHHLNEFHDHGRNISVSLIHGMATKYGLSDSNHAGFRALVTDFFPGHFQCCYTYRNVPVHAKLYIWAQDETPQLAFIGSANYSQSAMILGQTREAMSHCDAGQAMAFYNSLLGNTVTCEHPEVDEHIVLWRENRRGNEGVTGDHEDELENDVDGLPKMTVSLLTNDGELPQRSGLNWGQRPEYKRDPNQAYVRLPASVYRSDFFPPRGVYFTVLTDDGHVIICSRAQENGKAIHTPHNNSLLGEYFRGRLGVPNGDPVRLEDIHGYGRETLDFYKIDDETYYMDFSN